MKKRRPRVVLGTGETVAIASVVAVATWAGRAGVDRQGDQCGTFVLDGDTLKVACVVGQ